MNLSDTPFAEKKFMTVNGQRMAYIDEGEGDAIVFSHGNPTSSYLWRNIMPACRGLGRLVACDLIGQGDSDKLPKSGPERYSYFEQRSFIHALWDQLDLGGNKYSSSTTGVRDSASTMRASTPIGCRASPTWNRSWRRASGVTLANPCALPSRRCVLPPATRWSCRRTSWLRRSSSETFVDQSPM